MNMTIRLMAAITTAMLLLDGAESAVVKLQSGLLGYGGASDTWLDETTGQQRANYGASPTLTIRYDGGDGGYVEDCALLRFDLPSVQAQFVSHAVLELYYLQAGGMLANNAMAIKPYRVSPTKPWFENNRNGDIGEGASWQYFGQVENTNNEWTAKSGGWYDKIDDGNSSNLIKRYGGTVPGAIEPTNWVPFIVTPTVQQWFTGAVNNGFILFSSGFQGSGTEGSGVFASRENSAATNRPILTVHYSGAHIVWTGQFGNVWNTSATNWRVGNVSGVYEDGDHVRFVEQAAQTNILIGAPVSPASMTISNHAKTFSFAGAPLTGPMALAKQGTGTARLVSSNRFEGAVSISGGALEIATNAALGSTMAGTHVATGAELRLVGGVAYLAQEPLALSGTLSAVNGQSRWSGRVELSSGARLVAQNGELVIDGPLSGSGHVMCDASGVITFTGDAASAWTGALQLLRGTVNFDRAAPPVLDGDLAVGVQGAATALVHKTGQFLPQARLAIFTNSLVRFDATGATYRLERLVLRGGTLDAGLSAITLAKTVTAESASVPSRLKGAFSLEGTAVVVYAGTTPSDQLLIEGTLQGGGVDKMGFGDLLVAGENSVSSEWRVSQGTLTVAHPQGLGQQGVWVNTHSALRLAADAVWSNALQLGGALHVMSSATNAVWRGAIQVTAGEHLVRIATGASLVIETAFSSPQARLSIDGGGQLIIREPLDYGIGTQASNIVIAVSNASGSALGTGLAQLWNGARLTGRGAVAAPLWVESGGILQPGDPGGVLTVSNNVQFNAGGMLQYVSLGPQLGAIDQQYGGMFTIHSNAILAVNGVLEGTNPLVLVSRSADIKGQFFGLPPGASLPWPNQDWRIHYQPNAIYVGRNPAPLWYFRAFEYEGELRLAWRTPIEIGVVSFDLYRRFGNEWIKVNEDPVPSRHPSGGVYEMTDPSAIPGMPYQYRLVQNLENGRSNILFNAQRSFTPFEMTDIRASDGDLYELRWRSRFDESYRIERLSQPGGAVEEISGVIQATPEENSIKLPLVGTQGVFRVVLEP